MPGSGTPTSILGLNQYATGDDWDFNDVNADLQKMDRVPLTSCTSATRPNTDLFNGRLIYETDTDSVLKWDVATVQWILITNNGAWTTYAPAWTATVNPAIGNGTLTGRFKARGKDIKFKVKIVCGTTTTYGTSSWSFGIPTGSILESVGQAIGTAGFYDISAGVVFAGVALAVGASGVGVTDVGAGANARWQSGTPVAGANGDIITLLGEYELP